MPQEEDRDVYTGVYKSSDPVQKFKMRVHLRHVKAPHIPLPQFATEDRDHDGVSTASATASLSPSGVSESRGTSNDGEVRVFSWQEKVFSRFEVEIYSNLSNCHSAVQEQYHREVTLLSAQHSPHDRLFSYVHNDDTSPVEDVENAVIIGNKIHQNHLVEALHEHSKNLHYIPCKSNRKNWKRHHAVLQDGKGDTKSHIMQGVPQATCHKMYIMADLSPSNDVGKSEYVLCLIRWDVASSTLFITPDIGGPPNASKPYRIEVDGDARNVYEYWLEHDSNGLSEEETTREAEIRSKMYSHQADLRHLHVGDEFKISDSGFLSMYLFGQISSLCNFEDHNLFVHYFIELPKGWSCEPSETLTGISALSRPSKGVVHLGHPLQCHIKLSLSEFENSDDFVPHWPQLMVEVLSLDWWGRYRTEGYGYVTLPSLPGSHFVTCHTWRPLGSSSFSELRRFFVGGNPELDDVTFVGVPPQHEGPLLGKYGVQTAPSGDIHLSFNVVIQSPISLHRRTLPSTSALVERLSAATLVKSVNQVLEAFRRAHQRMLAAKQGLSTVNDQQTAD